VLPTAIGILLITDSQSTVASRRRRGPRGRYRAARAGPADRRVPMLRQAVVAVPAASSGGPVHRKPVSAH